MEAFERLKNKTQRKQKQWNSANYTWTAGRKESNTEGREETVMDILVGKMDEISLTVSV